LQIELNKARLNAQLENAKKKSEARIEQQLWWQHETATTCNIAFRVENEFSLPFFRINKNSRK
jgi:hypothetical protein